MNMTATGIISNKRGNFIDLDNGVSYSSWKGEATNHVNVGDSVRFTYVDKEGVDKRTGGTKVYHNIASGSVEILAKGEAPPVSTIGGGPPTYPAPKPGEPHLDKQRLIIRQTCVKAAVEILPEESAAEDVIGYARHLEAYCSGDLEADEARNLLSKDVGNPQMLGDPEDDRLASLVKDIDARLAS